LLKVSIVHLHKIRTILKNFTIQKDLKKINNATNYVGVFNDL